MEKKNVRMVDISSFLLIEGSADSEAENDEFLNLCEDMIMKCEYVDDDAESCSCDSTCKLSFLEVFGCEDEEDDQEIDGGDKDDIQYNKNKKRRSSKRWVEDEDGSECMCCKDGDEAESNLGRRKMFDQMDDRLFWETCMAVGYP